MKYQLIPYAWVLFTSALISFIILYFAWRRRTVPGARPFFVLMVSSVFWSLANALEMMGTDLPTKLFWANVQYICYNVIPVTWLVLALQYTGRDRWLTRRRLLLLLIIPVLTIVVAWTNQYHGLLRRDIFLDRSGPFPVVGKTYGPWFWVFAAYSYPLMIVSCVIHLRAMWRMQRLYRWQTLALLTGLVLPLLANLAFTLNLSPFKFDVAPTLFSIGGIFYTLAFFRFKLFDVLPAGRHLVIESMGDGMFIFDRLNRLIDFNPSAAKIFGITERMIGQSAEVILKNCTDLEEVFRRSSMGRRELTFKDPADAGVYYDARWWPVPGRDGQITGRLLLFHDITEVKQAQQEVLRQQRFAAMLEEREKLARELHDSLGQVFGYINVQAQAARKFIAGGQPELADEYLRKMIGAAKEGHAEVREFIQNGLNPVLTEKGLVPAIEDLLNKFSVNHGLETSFSDCREVRQGLDDPASEAQIFRIVQEALNNVAKHAEASQVRVAIEDHEAGMRLVIADNGKGFEPETVNGQKNYGLRIMHKRAEEAGCRLTVQSSPGEGTRILIDILNKAVENKKRNQGEAGTLALPISHSPHHASQRKEAPAMKVLLVDDHNLFLDGLASLLAANHIKVAGTARDGMEALQKARELKPDIIVMDIQMPRCDGLTATRLIKAEMPQIKIIMLTTSETDEVLFEAIKSGASGYLLKDLDGDEFVEMLLGLEKGEVPLSPGIAARFLNEFARNEAAAASEEGRKISEELTPRQIDILTMSAKGMTYKEIGAVLCLTERAIKYHMGEIVEKLQLKNRNQAIALAKKAGL